MIDINLVLCIDESYGISKSGDIPWRFDEDFKYFRDLIRHKVGNKQNLIIVGKNTYKKMGINKIDAKIVPKKDIKFLDKYESSEDQQIGE